jgi:hypothetical protein
VGDRDQGGDAEQGAGDDQRFANFPLLLGLSVVFGLGTGMVTPSTTAMSAAAMIAAMISQEVW